MFNIQNNKILPYKTTFLLQIKNISKLKTFPYKHEHSLLFENKFHQSNSVSIAINNFLTHTKSYSLAHTSIVTDYFSANKKATYIF